MTPETTVPNSTGLRSMTGYAVLTEETEAYSLTASLHSVNHRYLDLRLHMPDLLLPLENRLRALLASRGARGHLTLKLVLETRGTPDVAVDEALAARYLETMRRLGEQLQIPAQSDMETILQLPGVIAKRDLAVALTLTPEVEGHILSIVGQLVGKWDDMRAAEAAHLAADLSARVQQIAAAVGRMGQWQEEVLALARKRLEERLLSLASATGIDPARLAQEAALLAERTDVSEEIVRLGAHVQQFSAVIAGGSGDAGKKLDFLLQEMNRENNTMLSKINGLGQASLPMTNAGLEIKAEIEKLREQVQNLQ